MTFSLIAFIVLVLAWKLLMPGVVDPATSLKKISSVTFNSGVVGIVRSINGLSPNQWLKLRGQGKLGYGSTGLTGRDCEVTITYYGGGVVAVDGTTVGSIVCTLYEQDGATTRVATWTLMKADHYMIAHNDEAPPLEITAVFHYMGDMATDNFTLS
jgi:hypothetical protein